MAGPIYSKWYKSATPLFAAVNQQPIKNCFTAVADYFDQHPGFQRLASYYGKDQGGMNENGKGFGHMIDWSRSPWDGCWGVWRAVSGSIPYDIAFVASDTYALSSNTSSGNWGSEDPFGAGLGLHVTIAYHPSGAWNGTTGNSGSDSFGNPWKSGSLSPIRCNAPDAGNSASLNATVRLTDPGGFQFISFTVGSNAASVFITGDNDTTYLVMSTLTLGAPHNFTLAVLGRYEPASSNYDLPLTIFKMGVSFGSAFRGETVGSLDPNSGAGGALRSTSEYPKRIRVEYPTFMLTDGGKQSRVLEEDRFWDFPLRLHSYEPGSAGYLGTLEYLKLGPYSTAGIHRFYNSKTRVLFPIYLGSLSSNWGAITLPWNGPLQPTDW